MIMKNITTKKSKNANSFWLYYYFSSRVCKLGWLTSITQIHFVLQNKGGFVSGMNYFINNSPQVHYLGAFYFIKRISRRGKDDS